MLKLLNVYHKSYSLMFFRLLNKKTSNNKLKYFFWGIFGTLFRVFVSDSLYVLYSMGRN